MDISIKNNAIDSGKTKKWSKYGLIAIILWTGLLMLAGWKPFIMLELLGGFSIYVIFFFIQCLILYQAGKAVENFKIIPRSKTGWIYIVLGGFLFISLMPIVPVLVTAVFYGIGKGIEKFIKSRKK